jgi:hypothetical protein
MRQGEADLIIDLMNEFDLISLLPRGTKIWSGRDFEIIIDLVLASSDLASSIIKYIIYSTEYRSNYHAIKMEFNISIPILQT